MNIDFKERPEDPNAFYHGKRFKYCDPTGSLSSLKGAHGWAWTVDELVESESLFGAGRILFQPKLTSNTEANVYILHVRDIKFG